MKIPKTTFEIQDENGKILAVIKNGKIAISRDVNMSKEMRELIVEIALSSDINKEELEKFLSFEEDHDEFCS